MTRWTRIIAHADMDAFYAAVEQRDNPELRGKPILIGPNSHRGVVLTASYEARPYGVGSAMPVAEARRRCPHAIMVPPNFERYQAVSRQIMDVFADFSPHVEAISLDEAFLDMTGAEHFFGEAASMGHKIKDAVYEATQLHISVGVSGTKYVAKVASAHDKPNGLTVVPPDEAAAWLAPLPVDRLWGVGKKTAPRLQAMGFYTIGDVAGMDPATRQRLGSMGEHFYQLAQGQDPRRVSRGRAAKSIGSDRTLNNDVRTPEEITLHLRRSAERIGRRLRTKSYVARGVRVRLKSTDFKLHTRQLTLAEPTDTAQELLTAGTRLMQPLLPYGPFRLVGMAAFDLSWQGEQNQLDLFQDGTQRNLEAVMDQLTEKFGPDTVVRAKDMLAHGTVAKNGVNLDFMDEWDGERVARPADD